MGIQVTLDKGRVPVKIWTRDIEHEAIQQLVNVSQLPIVHGHIAAMPDVHAGIGATVGSVIPTLAAIIPAAVGVDIGCGMNAVRLSLTASDLPDNLRAYLHNPEGRMAMVSALSVRVRQGDPVLYGFFAPIQGPWTYR